MHQAIITKLIVWCAVAVLLIALLVTGLLTGGFHLPIFSFPISIGSYENSGDYTVGSYDSNETVTDLEIHWTSGRVILEVADTDYLTATETGNTTEETTMRYLLRDGKLILRDYPTTPWFQWNTSVTGKVLTVKVPKDFDLSRLNINTVSAESNVTGVNAATLSLENVSGGVELQGAASRSLTVETVSGKVTIKDVTAKSAKIETVSGNILYQGDADDLDLSTVSGNLDLTLNTLPSELEIDSTSGRATLTGAIGDGFALDFDSVSGDFECDYPVKKTKDTYFCGNGAGNYEFDSVSGNLIIRQPA